MQGSRDLLIRARREAYAATFPELRAELVAWARWLAGDGRATGERGAGA